MGKKKSAAQKAAAAAAAEGAQPSAAAPVAAAAADAAAAPSEQQQQGARATVRRSTMPATGGMGGAASGPSDEEAAAADALAAAGGDADALAPPPVLHLLIEAPNGKSVKVETTPSDCVLDVRQFLLDCPETAEYTCYHLESAATGVLNDYLELQDYPALLEQKAGQMSTLKIVPELYDDRASRLHVRRLRELLVKPPAHIVPSAVQAGYEDEVEDADKVAVVKKAKKASGAGKKEDAASQSPEDALTPADAESFSLKQFHVASQPRAVDPSSTLVDAVRNVSFSGWNPPPGNRALQGDLLYLEITTAEGVQAHVTANQEGFYVNQSTSTVFNPEKSDTPYMSLTLVQLLRRLSPVFQQKYTKACQRKVSQHPFEAMELSSANAHSHHWLAPAKPHTYDWNRSEDSLLDTFGMDTRGVQRDWNEEYQSCRELPRSTAAERVLRDRTMYRVYSDFKDAATKGAVAVVHGHIPPVNPMDAPRSYVFIYNSIFFSFAVDAKDMDDGGVVPTAAPAGAAAADVKVSYQMANQDLHGVRAYTELDLPELHTLATVLVDYRGHRVICQSIIPGIFHSDRASKHVYGSMNHGEVIESKPEFHALMVDAAKKLHIKPHGVLDGKGEEVELATCVESKGIVGSDGRNYVLDLLRVFPRDANFVTPAAAAKEASEEKDEAAAPAAASASPAALHSFLLRPELVRQFCRTRAFERLFPTSAEAKAAKEKDDAAREVARKEKLDAKIKEREDAHAQAVKEATDAGTDAPPALEALTEEQKQEILIELEREEMDALYTTALQEQAFNPDALTDVKLAGGAETIAADEKALKDLASYLKNDLLQKLVTGLRNLEMSPVDTQHLTALLHDNGINLRYLSSLITLANALHLPHIEAMCIHECIVRASKHIFNSLLRSVTPEKSTSQLQNKQHINAVENLYFAPLIAKFLNSLFGTHALGHKLSDEQMKAADTIVKARREEEAQQRREAAAAIAAAAAAAQAQVDGTEPAPAAAPAKSSATPVRDLALRLADGSRVPTDVLSPANLWQLIRVTVTEKFGVSLPNYLPITARSKICMLRSFCLKTGVQLLCRDYDLAPNSKNAVPFTVPDILDLFPIVKAHLPSSKDARELLESGTAYLTQGSLEPAYQLLSESLNVHHQVYGPMHVDTAHVYATLALTCYHAGETAQAVDFQQRAIIIFERVLGLDSHETAHAHMHQALFLLSASSSSGSASLAGCKRHMARALYLFELIAGPNHPDTAAAHINAAMIEQESGRAESGLKHVEMALERNQLALGPEHTQVALSHHTVAVAHALMGDFRNSVMHEKMAKSIYLAQLGNKHASVVRSHYWLEHFTLLAVKTQQTTNQLVAGKKGKKAEAAAAAAAEQFRKAATPATIIPPQMAGLTTALTWVSLHSSTAVKGKLSMVDMMHLLDVTARSEQAKAAAAAAAAAAPAEGAATDATAAPAEAAAAKEAEAAPAAQ